MIKAKSSAGFHRPKSLVAIWFCCRPFLFRLDTPDTPLETDLRFGSATTCIGGATTGAAGVVTAGIGYSV